MIFMKVILNGKEVKAKAGMTILDLAREHGIDIPTLCHDEELKPFGSCWVCAVKVEDRKGFVTSCGTEVLPDMVITTDNEEIHAARKMALELLISNHYADCEAPCKLACPDNVDVQTYVSLIANGKYHEAVKVIKDTLPMPLSIGRVCPAFCEAECRRTIIEEPVAIRQLKRYAADEDLKDYWQYIPEKKPSKGKKIAIVGGGPSGLTCGYYLSFDGFDVDIFEAEDKCGGWLRYGIPEYRLPEEILDDEIDLMCSGGMKIHYNKTLGKDFSLSQLSKDYDAVYLAIGAQNAVPMPVPGSDLEGCYLGVDYLKAHAKGKSPNLGKKVAIVGGGNTAIDCARTALRMGTEVTIIYRRTQKEMPADAFEIEAAQREGVNFYFLSTPVEYIGKNGKLQAVKVEKMILGKPDESGRRRPQPTGDFFIEAFDSIIAAISQVPEVALFAEKENEVEGKMLPISRWQTAIVDEESMYSGIANVFAGGDFQRGAASAIEAIADGRKAAEAIAAWLTTGSMPKHPFIFDAKRGKSLKDINPEEYDIFEKIARVKMPEIKLKQAKTTFIEVEKGFSEEEAQAEASRCIECGCQENSDCALRDYCSEYEIEMDRFLGSISRHPIDYSHPYIVRDSNRCINCARCIRTCAEIQGPNVLSFSYRGFGTTMEPELGESLTQTTCISCGKCIDVCPVGALVERNLNYKLNPLEKDKILQNCGLCGVGCDVEVQLQAGEVTTITTPPEPGFNGKNLCFKGRFGWQSRNQQLMKPLFWRDKAYQEISWDEAYEITAEKIKKAKTKTVEITPHITLEEMLIADKIASSLHVPLSANHIYGAFSDPLLDITPKEFALDILDDFDECVVVGELNGALLSLIRLKQRAGKKLTLVDFPKSHPYSKFADLALDSLDELKNNQKQLFIYNQNRVSEQVALKIHNRAKRAERILHTSDYANHSGFLAMSPMPIREKYADFALSFGREPAIRADFILAISQYEEDVRANLILPAPGFLDIDGHVLGDRGKISRFRNPLKSSIISELMRLFYRLDWISPATADIPYWNHLAEMLIEGLKERRTRDFSAMPKKEDLAKRILSSDAPIQRYLDELYENRHNMTAF